MNSSILIIDNYDSFTYNLVQYIGELDKKPPLVYRNDKITLDEIERLKVKAIIISPGPSVPENAGISLAVVNHFSPRIPILGVCLGHQCIGYTYGAEIIRAKRLMHGKTSKIHHDGKMIFENLPNPFVATRYHSLVINKATLPPCFEVSAWSEEDEEIMGIRHKEFYLVEGVQFHPESILTEVGKDLLRNFLRLIEK
jgi:anthranilate synthase/aminodeoxychorismate synthase-like glutamine amidotransferase